MDANQIGADARLRASPRPRRSTVARRAVAWIDREAIRHNVATLRGVLEAAREGEAARLCAVVKADGYGHGAVTVAGAAVSAGADWLAVATAREAAQLREAGIERTPILILGPLTPAELATALKADADVVAWTEEFVDGLPADCRVHVKLDTGMGRFGTRDPAEADRIARRAGDRLVGLMTHFATADEPGDEGAFAEQLQAFRRWAEPIRQARPETLLHCANSAATLRDHESHFDMCRCGIALYGIDPFHEDGRQRGLRPALELCSYVAALKACQPGQSVGYGRRFTAAEQTTIATVPIGYGDGLSRALGGRWSVLIGGRECPVVGNVSMDAITVEVPDGADVALGDEVTLLGGSRTAEAMARSLDTIGYEVTTRLGPRAERLASA